MLGPTGIGVLWARDELLEAMPPFLGGGEMILNVTIDGFTTNEIPWKFEAGTPPIAEIIGLGAAVDYLEVLGMDAVREHEIELTAYALRTLSERFGDRIDHPRPVRSRRTWRRAVLRVRRRPPPRPAPRCSTRHGVCVRAGHHCAKPLMRASASAATARASLYVYNDESDVDALADALDAAADFFAL